VRPLTSECPNKESIEIAVVLGYGLAASGSRDQALARGRILREWPLTGCHLIDHHPGCMDVGAGIDRVATQLFRSHVGQRACRCLRRALGCRAV